MNKYFYLLVFFISTFSILNAQNRSTLDSAQVKSISNIKSTFDHYVQDLAQEKIHVQFDKPNYQPGDTVWYKLYLINSVNNKLSALSKIAHLEVAQSNQLLRKQILPVTAGMAAGYLVLSDSLFKQGNYQFNVFTRLMGNKKKQFYTFNLKVGADSGGRMLLKQPGVLHFFPEGGTFVAGIRSKVVVQSLDDQGNPLATNGYVLDEEDRKVAEFNIGKSGMGVFAISPKRNLKYKAVLDNHPTDKSFPLPKVSDSGYVLAVNSLAEDTLMVRISASFKDTEVVKVVIQANGNIITEVSIKLQSGSAVLKVPKSILPRGLNEIALFSADNNLQANRLLFLPENKSPNTLLTLSQHEYSTREQVNMKLTVSDASGAGVAGGYAVSVAKVGDGKEGDDHQQTIWSSLIFGSDTPGNNTFRQIDFDDQSEVGKAELDMLLLSKKSDYPWNDIVEQKQKITKWKPEEGLSIAGKVLKANGKPMAGAKLNMFSAKDMILIDTVADNQGKFVFQDFTILDSAEVLIRVTSIGADKNVQIILGDSLSSIAITAPDTVIREVTAMNQGQPVDQKRANLAIRSKEKVNELKTVEIAAKRRPVIPGSVYPFAAAPPDYTIEAEELHKIMNLTDYLRSRLIGVTVINNKVVSPGGGQLIILLNGLNIEDLSFIDPRSLTGVEIIRGGIIAANMVNTIPNPHGWDPGDPNMYGQNIVNGIIFLTSNHHNPNFNKPVQQTTGIIRKKILGLSASKDFHSPNYALKPINTGKDLRNPLFWNPNIITGQDGKAVINFYTSDEKGKYQVTLEGIGINGQIVREVTFFTVD